MIPQVVTITSQGQISIPAFIRRKMGWEKTKKIQLEVFDDTVMLASMPDIMDLFGVFKTKKRIPWRTVRKKLDTAWARGDI